MKEPEAFEVREDKKNKKRKFLNEVRPPKYWNFFEDGPESEKVDHVLRYNAKPVECYADGRIEKIMENLDRIGYDLMNYENPKWNIIRKKTIEIFIELDKRRGQED